MTWAYFDTSALVKRYVVEKGRRQVLQLLRRHQVVTSAIVSVELRSAFRRRVSEGTLQPARLQRILDRASADREYWTLMLVSDDVLRSAENLAAIYPLRTLDALHVASAQLFQRRTAADEFIFVTADRQQAVSASSLGLATLRIES